MKEDRYEQVVSYIIENQEKFYRLAYSYVQNQEDALDVVQNAVCRALEHYDSLRNESALRTWFYRILVNESLLILKDKRKVILTGDGRQTEIPYEESRFEPGTELYIHINRLEADVQSIIKLRFYEELSLKEIAQVMEMNLNTVKAKLYRGLKALRVEIREVEV